MARHTIPLGLGLVGIAATPEWVSIAMNAGNAILGWMDFHAALLVFLATGATAFVAW